MDINKQSVSNTLLGIYQATPQLLAERMEALKYYAYYEGEAANATDVYSDILKGQSWEVASGLDYSPTQDIRNHAKKLIQKQARFMFSMEPNLNFKPLDKKNIDAAEGKRTFIDTILEDNEFWGETFKAFLDSTISKRVLMVVSANPDEPIGINYYTMDQFTFEVDKNNYKKLNQVIIAYQDADTADNPPEEQIWRRWKYYMDGTCKLEYGEYDGNAKLIEGTDYILDTMLDELPCRVIVNGGLLGDTQGTSDIKDLMSAGNQYNKTISDLRDSLRFKMFEQPVFTDADPASLQGMKIAPNAIIDLKTDPANPNGKADAKMLSSNFTFVEAVKFYLELTKQDMYEIMDQPRPEDVKNAPSAKAIRFTFYDLIARCEEKWKAWEPAVKWVVNFIIKAVDQFNLYKDDPNRAFIKTDTRLVIVPNYPIPEDEAEAKELSIREVEAKVKSIKTYIREHGNVEDEDGEFNEILQEIVELNDAELDQYKMEMETRLAGKTGEGEGSGEEGEAGGTQE